MSPHDYATPPADFKSSRACQTFCYALPALYTCRLARARTLTSRSRHSYGTPSHTTHTSTHVQNVPRNMTYAAPHPALLWLIRGIRDRYICMLFSKLSISFENQRSCISIFPPANLSMKQPKSYLLLYWYRVVTRSIKISFKVE